MGIDSNNSFMVVNDRQRRITMIEKIKTINPYDETEIDMDTNSVAGLVYENTPLVQKLNELVDKVNDLTTNLDGQARTLVEQQAKISILEEHAHPTATTKPADPYAEQRKWIGKLCKFWDDEDEGYVYEILIDIEDDGSDYPYKMTDTDSENWTMSYKHCEPVSEDLIYKGGNNE